MSERKNGNGSSAFWSLTNTVLIAAMLIIAGIFSYMAVDMRANAAEIHTVRVKAEVNAALINILGKSIPMMREQLTTIDQRLFRLEVRFNTLPEEEVKK